MLSLHSKTFSELYIEIVRPLDLVKEWLEVVVVLVL